MSFFIIPPRLDEGSGRNTKEIYLSKKTATYEIKVMDDNDILIASCQALAYKKEKSYPF